MIQRQLKLKLTPKQTRICARWLFQCAGVYNWVIRKMELDARGGKHWTFYGLSYKIEGHSKKCGIPSRMIG